MKIIIKRFETIGHGLKKLAKRYPARLKEEIYPHYNRDPRARSNEQENYPGPQPDIDHPDRFSRIGKDKK